MRELLIATRNRGKLREMLDAGPVPLVDVRFEGEWKQGAIPGSRNVPLHRLRLLSRRFNQAAEIARPLARDAGLDYLPDALTRRTHTTSQGGKSRRGRRLNVKKAFVVSEIGRRRIKGRRILLIDDVLTTGATGEACARALIDAGARAVDLAVIARVRNARELTM